MDKGKTWIEIHAACGDCGRRTVDKLDCERVDLKTCLKMVNLYLVDLYHAKLNMACTKCSTPKSWKESKKR